MDFHNFGLGDAIMIFMVMLAVPFIMGIVINRCPNLKPWDSTIAAGAVFWLLWALVSEALSTSVLGVAPADALGHYWAGTQNAAEYQRMIVLNDFSGLGEMFEMGNPAFRMWVGFIYWLTACTRLTINVFNGFLGWWGSLVLLGTIAHRFPHTRIPAWLVAMTMALPTAVFWTSMCLKEAPMYWGICQFIAMVFLFRRPTVTGILGAVAMLIMRPHIAIIWLGALAFAASITGKNKFIGGLALIGSIVGVMMLSEFTGKDVTSISDATAVLEHNRNAILTSGGSVIDPNGAPIPIVSGALVLFFRPFPWEAHGMRGLLTSAEILAMTGLIFNSWFKLKGQPRLRTLILPEILMALGVCFLFMFLYTYMGNMGLLARQRLQALPALVMLAGIARLMVEQSARTAEFAPTANAGPVKSAFTSIGPLPVMPRAVRRSGHERAEQSLKTRAPGTSPDPWPTPQSRHSPASTGHHRLES